MSRLAGARRGWAGSWGGVLIVGLVLVILPLTSGNSYQLALFTELAISLLMLVGLNVISGYGGQFSLGQATFQGIGAYFATLGALNWGMSSAIAFILAPLATALIAIVIGLPSLRLRGMYFAMATLGVGVVFVLLINDTVSFSGGPNGIGGAPPLSVFGATISSPRAIYWMSAVFAWLGLVAAQVFIRSRMGWGLRASKASEPAAAAVGINTFAVRLTAFALSGALAGLAGAIEAFYSGWVTPDSFTWGSSVVLFVALAIGGFGTFAGPVIGAFILYAFSRWLTGLNNWEPVILGVTFLLCLRLFPGGIANTVANLAKRVRDTNGGQTPDRLDPQPVSEQPQIADASTAKVGWQ